MVRIAVAANKEKEGADILAEKIVSEFPENCFIASGNERADAAVILGGDGTILSAVRRFPDVPLLGINFGTIGYMTAVEKDDALSSVKRVIDKDYSVEERMMLSVRLLRDSRVIAEWNALNDGVLSRSERVISLSEYFGSEKVYSFTGDGVIIATPTGSTAYSLSAGGPVAPPDMNVILSTPVCPHSIQIRPLIAPDNAVIRLCVNNTAGNTGLLIVDGQKNAHLLPGDEVIFEKSERSAKLICLEKKNFYDILRYKLSGAAGE